MVSSGEVKENVFLATEEQQFNGITIKTLLGRSQATNTTL